MTDSLNCPRDCDGVLVGSVDGWYRCDQCENEIRSSVVSRIEAFQRVAERNTPATKIAAAALGLEKTPEQKSGIQW